MFWPKEIWGRYADSLADFKARLTSLVPPTISRRCPASIRQFARSTIGLMPVMHQLKLPTTARLCCSIRTGGNSTH